MAPFYRQCPACRSDNKLRRAVLIPGWQDARLRDDGTVFAPTRAEAFGVDELDGNGDAWGCSCGWEGTSNGLLRIGWDGKPLQEVHPAQERLT